MPEITVRCTSDNAAQFRELVNSWPELHTLVRELQGQDLFPGLRSLQATVSSADNADLQGDVVARLARRLQAERGAE